MKLNKKKKGETKKKNVNLQSKADFFLYFFNTNIQIYFLFCLLFLVFVKRFGRFFILQL